MRITLVSPLTSGLSPSEARDAEFGDSPLGILTLAAVARTEGHSVEVLDLDYLSSIAATPRFLEAAADRLAAAGSEVYGFGTICSSYPLTLRIARELRRRSPRARIIAGGPQATVTDVATLHALPELDLVVRGEADHIFPQLLSAFEHDSDLDRVPGITYRRQNHVTRTADAPVILDLDAVPDPAWDLDPVFSQRPDASVEIGRGCPFDCEFCSTNDFFRRKFRMKSPARVLAQMKEIERRYGIRKFSLVHDMFTVDRRKVVAFCEAAAALGAPFEWGCSARTDCVDPELLDLMYRGGCRKVFYGVESGSAKIQRSMRKDLDLDQARQAILTTDSKGMRSTVSLIVGFPDETEQDLRDTVEMFLFAGRREHTDVYLHLLGALAGTPITTRHNQSLELDLNPDSWSGDPEDADLIGNHPDVFVNFYTLPTLLPRRYIRELKLFIRCGWLRCNWLLQTLHREGGHICSVFARFYDPSAQRSNEWYRSPEFETALLHFAAELTEWPQFIASRVMVDYYRKLSNARPASSRNGLPVPLPPPGAVLVHCAGDALRIIEALRNEEALPADGGQPSWILVGATGELTQLTALAGEVLAMCDGSRTVPEIGALAKKKGLAPAPLEDEAVGEVLLDGLRAAGVVRMEAAAKGAQAP